jgi:transcription elongation GreA/GreB family factor
MSQAFVKEPDGDQVADDQPELPQSPHPNYVTPGGLAALEAARADRDRRRQAFAAANDPLADKPRIAQIEREIRFYEERIRRAILVEPTRQPPGDVAFGARVTVEDDDGATLVFTIVGEDEADPNHGKVSWISPLASALLDAQVGDLVTWKRPAGDRELEIMAIDYSAAG